MGVAPAGSSSRSRPPPQADLYKLIDLDSARAQQANLGIQPNKRINP